MVLGPASFTNDGRMMRVACFRQRFRSAFPEEALDARPLGAHPVQIELGRARTRDHDEVDPVGDQARPGAEALSAKALDAVSPYRIADPAPDDETEPRGAGSAPGTHDLRRHEKREVRRAHSPRRPLALGANELRMLAQPAMIPPNCAHYLNARCTH
jgi:hypothetical protein